MIVHRAVSVILLLILCTIATCHCDAAAAANTYTVPQPEIQAFSPRGLKVAIPHSDGIGLFAFHGNVNRPLIGHNSGELSNEIYQRKGHEWVFEDRDIELKVGDKIYYWLFVLKDRLGYRYGNGYYEVESVVPWDTPGRTTDADDASNLPTPTSSSSSSLSWSSLDPTSEVHRVTNHWPTRDCQDAAAERLVAYEKVLLNVTQTLMDLQQQIESLRDMNDIYRDILDKHPNASKSLTLGGRFPFNDPLVAAQEIVRYKLNTSISVVSATFNDNKGITFQVESLRDKIAIINAAKDKLKYSKFYLGY